MLSLFGRMLDGMIGVAKPVEEPKPKFDYQAAEIGGAQMLGNVPIRELIDRQARRRQEDRSGLSGGGGVNPGFLGPALVLEGAKLVNENAGPDRAVRLLEGLIETLEAPPKRPDLRVVGEGSGAAGDGRGDVCAAPERVVAATTLPIEASKTSTS